MIARTNKFDFFRRAEDPLYSRFYSEWEKDNKDKKESKDNKDPLYSLWEAASTDNEEGVISSLKKLESLREKISETSSTIEKLLNKLFFCPSFQENKVEGDHNSSYRCSILHVVVRNKNPNITKLLLQYGADPNLHDEWGVSVILMVSERALRNDNAIVSPLLDNSEVKLDPNELGAALLYTMTRSMFCFTPAETFYELRKKLLTRGANPNLLFSIDGWGVQLSLS